MKQSTRPAAVTAAVILVLELAGAAFWGHAALHREAYTRAYNLLPIAVLELAVQPLMLAGAAYLLLWALDRLFLSPYSWLKKTDVASKTRQGGALCPVGRVALRLLAAAMVVVYLALVLGGLFGRVSGLTVEWLLRLRFLLVIPGAVLYAGMKAPPPAQEEPAD